MIGSVSSGILGKNGTWMCLPCWNRQLSLLYGELSKWGCSEDKDVDGIAYFQMLSVFSLFKK